MGYFSILPESLAVVETWLTRLFVSSLAYSMLEHWLIVRSLYLHF
jgi:hypothetical protein